MTRTAIFGATSAIAVEVARILAKKGGNIVLVGRDDEKLVSLEADLKVRGAQAIRLIKTDFAFVDGLGGVANAAWQSFSGLDFAFVAYGTLPDQAVVQDNPAATEAAIAVNFTSPAALCSALAPKFERAGAGVMGVITSVAGDRGRRSNYVYGAAKGGLQTYLQGLRHRLHRTGVKVLDIRPGFVATPMTAAFSGGGPLWASPGDVAADIVAAAERGADTLYSPWFWRPIMWAVRAMPAPLFHQLRL